MKTFILTLSLAAVAGSAGASVPFPTVERPQRGNAENQVIRPHKSTPLYNKGLSRVSPSGKVLMGYQGAEVYGNPMGIYRLNTDAELEFLYADEYTNGGYTIDQGWLREGRLCALVEYSIFDIEDLRYLEMDPYTGEIYVDQEIPIRDPETTFPNYLPAFWSAAYDVDNDMIYAYGPSENGQGYAFISAPGNKPQEAKCVRTPNYKEVCVSMAYNSDDKQIYGINRNDDLVIISPETGEQTVVMPTGIRSRYAVAGMVYIPETKKFLIDTMTVDYLEGLAEIDLQEKTVTQLFEFDNLEKYSFFFLADAESDPAPIRKPEIDEVKFNHSTGEGTISYFIPSEYFVGGNINGNVKWYATLDNKPYSEGTAAVGDIVTVSFKNIATDNHDFGFYVQQDAKKSAVNCYSMYVGYDIPNAPTDVTLSEKEIKWTGVTRCVNGGHLEVSELKYHVYLNDEEIGVTKDTHFNINIPADTPYCSYRAKVVADNMGQLSQAASSASDRWGAPWNLDFTMIPTNADASVCSAFDINGDKNVWDYFEDENNPGQGAFYSARGTSESEDWLFLPPMNLDETAVSYEITYEIGNFSAYYDDIEVGVFLHNSLDPRTSVTTIQETRKFNNTKEYDTYTQRFAITEPGTYYISFFNHAPAYHSGVRLRNISVRKLRTANTLPVEVGNLKVKGADKGELKALIEFDLPTKYISGENIPASTGLTATVTLGEEKEVITGKPGEHFSMAIPSKQGWNRLHILTSIGDLEGKESVTDVFTGIDVPGPVSSIGGYVTEDNLTMVAQWTAPTEGENGYYIDPDDVVYNVMAYTEDGWVVAEELGKNVFEYRMSVPKGSALATTFLGIAASTVQGICSTVGTATDVLGTPYKLPVEEKFENASFKYSPIRIIRLDENYADSEWGVVNPRLIDPAMAIESQIACYGRSEGPSQKGMLMLPKFDIENVANPGIVFNIWTGPKAAEITVYGETHDSDGFVELGKLPQTNSGWMEWQLPFPDSFLDNKWAAIYIDANFPTESHYALFSDYTVRGGVTGLHDVPVGEGWIRSGLSCVLIEGFAGQQAGIYSLDGRIIWTGTVTEDSFNVPVAPGTYVVRAGSNSVKLVVR